MRHFCALCLDPIIGNPKKQPLGRNDALVNVCDTCDSAHPTVRLGPERGYEVREGASMRKIRDAADRLNGDRPDGNRWSHGGNMSLAPHTREKTDGWLLIRVPQRRGMDWWGAVARFKLMPWFKEMRYVGATSKWFLFERPDPNLAAEHRAQSFNPIAWLEMANAEATK